MLTLDNFLINIVDTKRIDKISHPDKKILNSLRQQLKRQYFFTEKQGNLLKKMLQNNYEKISNLTADEDILIKNPLWSQDYRIVFPIKRIYFSKENPLHIVIDCVNNKEIRQKINDGIQSVNQRDVISANSSQLVLKANEFTIVSLLELVKNDNFEIDKDVLDYYLKITEAIEKNQNLLDLKNTKNKKVLDILTDDLQDVKDTNLFFLDRRHRYQYTFNCNIENTLSYKIASRNSITIWINEANISLDQLFQSLLELKRFPILFIFDENDVENCSSLLLKINESLEFNQINKKVGIYFRFDNNNEIHEKFNKCISNLGFNTYLDETTTLVGITHKHLPKFLFKSKWYPNTVITNASNFRSTKALRYCDQVDLVISYSKMKPLTIGDDLAIM